jgi:hypothetical protein
MKTLKHLAAWFMNGVGSALVVCPAPPPAYLQGSDEDALRSDWQAIGNDIASSMKRFETHRLAQLAPENETQRPSKVR